MASTVAAEPHWMPNIESLNETSHYISLHFGHCQITCLFFKGDVSNKRVFGFCDWTGKAAVIGRPILVRLYHVISNG
jgi:hypothetical protein